MKTLKEFDYDLWAIEENGRKRYFARIKATGEETEVSLEVMRLLLRQEKQMRREYAKQQTIGPVLSLDAIRDGGSMDESAWLLDMRQRIDSEVLTAELTDAFCKTLTDSQRSIFTECLIEGKSQSAYVIHYHANIHKALKYAVKLNLISGNPADKIERPKKERFMASFYDADEVNRLFEISKGTRLEIPILFGAFYGMRRSEALGMKWDAIDFELDTITIRHTLTTVALDGKRITVAEDRTKNKSSMRTLPLVPFVKERLMELKAEQEENRRLCGRSYVKDYAGYVCINEIGDIIKPDYVSCGFPKLLEEHGLRRVRYHDLRHSCASLLLANGIPMKQIQEWLGHSDFSTTANTYAHLEYSSKVVSADAMLAGLGIENRE